METTSYSLREYSKPYLECQGKAFVFMKGSFTPVAHWHARDVNTACILCLAWPSQYVLATRIGRRVCTN